jgi:hypothetical protein
MRFEPLAVRGLVSKYSGTGSQKQKDELWGRYFTEAPRRQRQSVEQSKIAAQFLRTLIAAVADKLHPILTDNGIQFANRATDKYALKLLCDHTCEQHGIEHWHATP